MKLINEIVVVLEAFRKERPEKYQMTALCSLVKRFCSMRGMFTDGEPLDDAITRVTDDLVMWAIKQTGQLKAKQVGRQLTNRGQKEIDRAKEIIRKEKILTNAPLMEMLIFEEESPEEKYEKKEMYIKALQENQKKKIQNFWETWDEIQHRTEDEWEFMQRLPVDNFLWHFLLLVGMKEFSIFFHRYQGVAFHIPDDKKIERVMKLRRRTSKDFEQGVLKSWFKIDK